MTEQEKEQFVDIVKRLKEAESEIIEQYHAITSRRALCEELLRDCGESLKERVVEEIKAKELEKKNYK